MNEKKTVEPTQDIQKNKRTAMVSHRMKQEVTKARNKAQHYSDDGQESPAEYAEDTARNATDEIIYDSGHGIHNAVKGAARKGGSTSADKQNPAGADTQEETGPTPRPSNVQRQAIMRTEQKKTATRQKEQQRETVINESVANTQVDEETMDIASQRQAMANRAKANAKKDARKKQGTAIQRDDDNYSASSIPREKYLDTAKQTAKTDRVQRSYLAEKKAAQTEYRNARRQQRMEQTKNTAKSAADTAKRIYDGIIRAAESLIAALTAGGSTLAITVVVICLVGLLVGSCFGIFFSNEDTGTMKMKDVVKEINTEYLDKIDEIKSRHRYDVLVMEGSRASWRDVLAIYAVKTTSDRENGQEVVTVTEEKKDIIREIFWDMNELSERTEVEYETQTVMEDDGEGNLVESTETVTIVYLYITVEHKTAEDMEEEYSFGKNQKQQLAELLSPEYASMWSSVLYGISSGLTDSDEMLVTVALSQVGNIGGEPYWSWYGYSHRVEWCACFVSWCMDQCGYIDAGIAPKFADCESGVRWFQQHGQWMDGDAVPTPGSIVFFDWVEDGTQDGEPEHVGIVTRVEDGYIWTVEGNTNDDMCCEKCYQVGNVVVLGYGIV